MHRIRNIINLVDDVSSVNYGIWHAAIASSGALFKQFGIESWLVSSGFDASFHPEEFPWLKIRKLESVTSSAAESFFSEFRPEDSLIASHGCWQFPTRWAAIAARAGFSWIYTPHGMLEPWSMEQKAWKKIPYFYLAEKPMAARASLVRAVGRPELLNLRKHFPDAMHIPNGIYPEQLNQRDDVSRPENRNHFLFLARLHHKKNVLPLVRAWIQSGLAAKPDCLLRIAGTDDGEKEALEKFILENPDSGITYMGPVFGEAKARLFADSDFYILPSLSEGFPTSVVEAAASGLICLISGGCNFPELLDCGAGMESGIQSDSIVRCLRNAASLENSEREAIRSRAGQLISGEFTWDIIAAKQAEAFGALLGNP